MSERSGGFFRRGGRDGSGDSAESQGPRGSEAGSGDSTAHGSDQDVDGLSATDDRTAGRSGWRGNRSDSGDDRTAESSGRDAEEPATPGDRTAGSSGPGPREDRTAGGSGRGAEDAAHAESQSQSGGRSKGTAAEDDPIDGLAEFAAELKLLAESVLERVEPVLRQAADGQVEWSSCNWCPVCAAAALMRGQHHEVLQSVADHGTAIVTVLREALAGVPVEPVMPEYDPARHQHNHGVPTDSTPTGTEPTAGHHTSRTGTRSRYVSIPVTIKA
ncbi:hypothetical protein NONI108955_41765 [Nocardia ninae]|uniref:Uncharacterized protein n=1 Tax=Nocardia ninae NBRC 108245 TaxID=1210091 RepID=A0A511MGR5_9NOCA|nr:hypothetical protein [Nocardia ninae]GEM39844.1 hypothetical protein NN4_43630 [Nocardia ninae NBRC 108245]